MKVLHKNLLSHVAGGEADEVVYAYGGGDTGSDAFGGAWSGAGDYGWDDSGGGSVSMFVAPAFDANGVGSTSCVPMPPPPAPLATGLFGYSMSETLTLGGGLGGGIGASVAIEAIGGWSAIGTLGATAPALVAATGVGIGAAAAVGWTIGGAIYNNSETVQEWSQKAWGGVFQAIEDVTQGAADILDIDRKPHPVYHP